jgi:hypothetical protein
MRRIEDVERMLARQSARCRLSVRQSSRAR